MEPAPIIVPGEPGPASSRAVQVSLGGGEGLASAEVAGGAEELEFSDQSSVDMPFDISLVRGPDHLILKSDLLTTRLVCGDHLVACDMLGGYEAAPVGTV